MDAASAGNLCLTSGFFFKASNDGAVGSSPMAETMVLGNLAGLAVATTMLGRLFASDLKPQAVCGSAM